MWLAWLRSVAVAFRVAQDRTERALYVALGISAGGLIGTLVAIALATIFTAHTVFFFAPFTMLLGTLIGVLVALRMWNKRVRTVVAPVGAVAALTWSTILFQERLADIDRLKNVSPTIIARLQLEAFDAHKGRIAAIDGTPAPDRQVRIAHFPPGPPPPHDGGEAGAQPEVSLEWDEAMASEMERLGMRPPGRSRV